MILVAPRSAKLVEARGARAVLLLGYLFILAAFVWMLLTWNEGIEYWVVGVGYALVGIGVGLAGTPASRSLTSSVPIKRVGMASGTADLQRDLGGAIMQSIFGALLAVGFASAMGATIAASPNADQIPASDVSAMEASYSSAATLAVEYPQYSTQIYAAAKQAFLAGDQDAYLAGIIAVLIGGALVFFVFPKRDEERDVLAKYHAEDIGESGAASQSDLLTKPSF
jgi:hypothetical protein